MSENSIPKRLPPPEPIRLMMTAFMAFIKGAVISAIVIAPFLGIWAAVGTSLAFTSFCVWLAHKKGPGTGLVERKKPVQTTIKTPDSSHSKGKKMNSVINKWGVSLCIGAQFAGIAIALGLKTGPKAGSKFGAVK